MAPRAHHNQDFQPLAAAASKPPALSQAALQEAELWRPIRLTDRTARQLFVRAVAAQNEADHLRAQGRLALAEQLEAHADLLLQKIDAPGRVCNLLVFTDSDERVALPEADLTAAAAWLHDTPTPLSTTQLGQILSRSQLEDCQTLLVHLSEALIHPTKQSRAELTTILQTGLARKLGGHLLGPAENIYFHLLAGRAKLTNIRVCTTCNKIFKAARAEQCRTCVRRPPRPKPGPQHRSIILPDRRPHHGRNIVIQSEHGSTVLATRQLATNNRITYNGECEYGDTFGSHDARRKYCEECGTPAARVARYRATHATPRPNS